MMENTTELRTAVVVDCYGSYNMILIVFVVILIVFVVCSSQLKICRLDCCDIIVPVGNVYPSTTSMYVCMQTTHTAASSADSSPSSKSYLRQRGG